MYTDEEIARVIHAANRAMQDIQGDDSPSLPWFWEPRDVRAVVLNGVARTRSGDVTAEQHHHAWCIDKAKNGWVYGEVKDPERKTHPCLLPWEHLPPYQQDKSRLFIAIVRTMTGQGENHGDREG